MKRSALALLLLGSVNAGCFHPVLACLPCGEANLCPSGLTCNAGFCSTPGDVCAPGGASDGSADGDDAQPSICVGGSCLRLSSSVREGLIVWADRTSLPSGGQPIASWMDRSGNNHPVEPFNPGAPPPLVQLDGVGPLVEIANSQSVLAVQDGTGLNLGTSDFAIMVLARCDSDSYLPCVFDDTTVQRPQLGLKLYCNVMGAPYVADAVVADRAQLRLTDNAASQLSVMVSRREDTPDRLHLYVARRIGGVLQFRMDGEIQDQTVVSSDFNQNEPLFVGSCTANPMESSITTFRGALGAVIVIEGQLSDTDLLAIEGFVLATMGPGAPPLP